jgi:hypothetical protein
MKNIITLFLFSIIFLASCSDSNTEVNHKFPINKYRGYRVLKKNNNDAFSELYVIRNDSFAIELVMPKCFSILYKEGDTIK